jgi:hypothetical protein
MTFVKHNEESVGHRDQRDSLLLCPARHVRNVAYENIIEKA